MRILQIHNAYFSGKGGEDIVIENEAKLLNEAGFEVVLKSVATQASDVSGIKGLAKTALKSVYSFASRKLVREWVNEVKPDVVHVHNTFPLLSPSILHELHALGIPTVVTLHNYRLVCANALLLHEGSACNKCVTGSAWNAVKHSCYKDSKIASGIQATRRVVHDWLGTYSKKVDAIIVLSEFARDIFAESGIPQEKMYVKPNFVMPRVRQAAEKKNRVVFVGRLVEEKGVDRLVEAWKLADLMGWELHIVGEGHMREQLEAMVSGRQDVVFHGWKSQSEVRDLMADAKWLTMPSVCYEGFGMVLVEAFSEGTPVIVPQLGVMPEVAGHGQRGLVYDQTVEGLAQALRTASAMPSEKYEELVMAGQDATDGEYASDSNLLMLMSIYRTAATRHSGGKVPVFQPSQA